MQVPSPEVYKKSMANNYKFKGVALATTSETALLTAASFNLVQQ